LASIIRVCFRLRIIHKSRHGMPRQRNESGMSLFVSDNYHEGSQK